MCTDEIKQIFCPVVRPRILCLVMLLVVGALPKSSFAGEEIIFFSSYRDNAWTLMSIRPDSSQLKTIEWMGKNVRSPAVGKDHTEIAAITADRNLRIYSRNDNVATLSLPKGIYAQPAWNNDGSTLAYVMYKVKPSDQSEIWQINRDSEGNWQVPERVSKFPPMRLHPSFSPDGRFLLYTEFNRHRLLGVVEELGVYNFKEKSFHSLTTDKKDSFYGRWSPDGKHIAYVSDMSGNYDIWLLSLQGKDPFQFQRRQLTKDAHFDGEPSWSPDSRQLAFVSTRSGSREIWKVSVDGGSPAPVTTSGKSCKEPVWCTQ